MEEKEKESPATSARANGEKDSVSDSDNHSAGLRHRTWNGYTPSWTKSVTYPILKNKVEFGTTEESFQERLSR